MSMASFIGYLPGAFMYAVYGSILDSHQGIDGYQIVFPVMTVFTILGVLLSTYITHRIKAAHTRECKIVCVNRYCMNLLYAPYWGKQR